MTDDEPKRALDDLLNDKPSGTYHTWGVRVLHDGQVSETGRAAAPHETHVRVVSDTHRIFIAASLFGDEMEVLEKCSSVAADDAGKGGMPVIRDDGHVLVPADVIARLIPTPDAVRLGILMTAVLDQIFQVEHPSKADPDDVLVPEPEEPEVFH